MATSYLPYNPAQSLLLPPSPEEWLPEGHLAYFISDTVDALDLSAFHARYANGGPRNQPFHPAMMVKVLGDETPGTDISGQTLTAAVAVTQPGVVLGTAAYMSPEQARGRTVDRRADIWAFGVVLWEMLTGHKLFEGETVTDVLAAVLTPTGDMVTMSFFVGPMVLLYLLGVGLAYFATPRGSRS